MKNQTKHKYISILIAVIVIAIFTACNSTVETAIEPTPTENITQNTVAPTQDKVSIQNDHVKVVLSPKAENVSIELDADIKMPNAKSFPIVELVPKKITQEQVDNFLDTFFSGRVDNLTIDYIKPPSKSDIKKEIELREKYIKDTKKLIPKGCKGKSLAIPKWEKEIATYKELYKVAYNDESEFPNYDVTKFSYLPELIQLRDTDPDLELFDYDRDFFINQELYHTKHISYSFEFDDSNYSVYAKQSDDPQLNFFSLHKHGSLHSPSNYDRKTESYKDIPSLKTTYKQAKSLADKAVESLGLDGMDLYKSSIYSEQYEQPELKKPRLYYFFVYSWDIEGTNVTFTTQDSSGDFYLLIDDSGIAQANYKNPATLANILPRKTELLTLEEIIKVASDAFESKDYLYNRFTVNKNIKTVQATSYDAVIEKVEFGYMMLKDDYYDKCYMLIPVWDFFGREGFAVDFGDYTLDKISHSVEMPDTCGNGSLLTINAINGNVINRMNNVWRD